MNRATWFKAHKESTQDQLSKARGDSCNKKKKTFIACLLVYPPVIFFDINHTVVIFDTEHTVVILDTDHIV